jgi:dipeptidyl aminopeptidase/acylaminoacyl peptidase
VVSVGSRSAPATYYLVDFQRGTADTVGEEYPALVGTSLGEVRPVSFKARDGYDVQAYLTLPPALEAKKLPLVILDRKWHEGREGTIFDPMAQFLASRGYAVLQPQGRKIGDEPLQDDITASVRAMVAHGIADPGRVCVVGYGGHVALAGVAFTPELYACAISVNGFADFADLIKNHRQSESEPSLPEYLEAHPGRAERPSKAALSLPRAASNVRAPILLMHDLDNPLVPIGQARRMLETLGGRLRLPHQLIELPVQDTWPLRRETWSRELKEIEEFLAKHLAPKEEP